MSVGILVRVSNTLQSGEAVSALQLSFKCIYKFQYSSGTMKLNTNISVQFSRISVLILLCFLLCLFTLFSLLGFQIDEIIQHQTTRHNHQSCLQGRNTRFGSHSTMFVHACICSLLVKYKCLPIRLRTIFGIFEK